MDHRLTDAFDLVLVDLRSAGVPIPELVEGDWADDPEWATAYLCSQDGGSTGIRVTVDASEADRVAEVADQVQEWVIEELWPERATNWPRCLEHPDTHPLSVVAASGVARWVCPISRMPSATIGALGARDARRPPCDG